MDHRRASGFRNAALLTLALAALALAVVLQQLQVGAVPTPMPIPVNSSVLETMPLLVTVTRDWKKSSVQASIDEVTWSVPLWREMHFGDWDSLPEDARRRGLMRMRLRFAAEAEGPMSWSAMEAADWDAVPQPIRMVVFPLMIEHWVRYYGLGKGFGLPQRLMTDTVSAIVMAESWFQHGADVENAWGNRDIGLGQCSDRCRRDLAQMAEDGLLGFALAEEDYLNPWKATRAAVVWFGLELARGYGDVDLAIRAYHRGFEAACKGEGTAYLKNVRRLRGKYFGPQRDFSPTWRALAGWAAERASMEVIDSDRMLTAVRPQDEADAGTPSSAQLDILEDVARIARQIAARGSGELAGARQSDQRETHALR